MPTIVSIDPLYDFTPLPIPPLVEGTTWVIVYIFLIVLGLIICGGKGGRL